MRVFVTGPRGFVGARIMDELGRDAGPRHHLWMDCAKIKRQGIFFCNTVDGLQKCIQDYSL